MPIALPSLQALPEHVGIEAPAHVLIHVYNVDIAFGLVADDGAVEVTRRCVLRNVDAERAVYLQFEPGKRIPS